MQKQHFGAFMKICASNLCKIYESRLRGYFPSERVSFIERKWA